MPPFRLNRLIVALAAVLPLALAGCATMSAPTADAGKPDATTVATANAAAQAAREATPRPPPRSPHRAPRARRRRPPPPRPPPRRRPRRRRSRRSRSPTSVKDAKETEGLLRVWQKDDRVWIEVAPDQLDKPLFFKSNINQGIGEGRIFGGAMNYPMGVAQVVVFHKVGNTMQLIAKNTKYTAKEGTPEARAVAAGFSDSLLAVAPVVAQAHPTRKSWLIDANALLLADIPMAATQLERTYRQPYGFDARNSSFGKVTGADDNVTVEVTAHYALSRLMLPPPPPAPNTLPMPPITLPDVRSMFIGYHYSFSRLPEAPMAARLADERIGYFTTDRLDFTSDVPRVPVTRYVNRWRLEKKDPAAALSEPKQPIVFWLDRNIPVKYRAAIGEGILEWNKAFERIGYKDAIKVEVQPDDADFDTSDIRHASIRWQTVAKTAYGAIGPSVVDPRTGEILDADIGFDANNVRVVRNLKREYITGTSTKTAQLAEQMAAQLSDPTRGPSQARSMAYCTYDDLATQQAAFGLSLLEARGDLDVDGPDLDKFVNAFLKDVTMHEVGHTLGLRHNFRASTIYTEAQLIDPEFTKKNGIAGSVMEYNPWNISLRNEKQGEYQMSTLGPYDYWAIEYGYKEVDRAQEAAELDRIASRSSEPLLAYSTDEDVAYFAVDPAVNQGDLVLRPARLREEAPRPRARAVAAHGEDAAAARRELLGAAPQLHARPERGRPGRRVRGALHRRPHHAARPRRQRPPAVRAGGRRQAAPGARPHRHRDLLGRQLQLLAVVPAQDDGVDLRHGRRRGARPADPAARLPGRPAAPDDAEERARRADEPDDRAAPAQQRREDRRRAPRAEGVGPLRHAACGDLERAQDRPRHHAVPAQPAARARAARRQRAAAAQRLDARRRARARCAPMRGRCAPTSRPRRTARATRRRRRPTSPRR